MFRGIAVLCERVPLKRRVPLATHPWHGAYQSPAETDRDSETETQTHRDTDR